MLDKSVYKPVPVRWSVMKSLRASYHDNVTTDRIDTGATDETSLKVRTQQQEEERSPNQKPMYMGPDYGADNFNSGVMLYQPQLHMFEDFQQFLYEKILPMKKSHKRQMVRSTQRLLSEFLLLPSTQYELVNFCPGTSPAKCNKTGCPCRVHMYPTILDCRKDEDLEQLNTGTIAHFAGRMLDYESLCDPKNGTENITVTIDKYKKKHIKAQAEHKKKIDWDMTCQVPMLKSIRNLYFDAIHRVG